MSLKALYSLTGTMMMMGLAATLYGMQSSSCLLFLEGLILLWLSFSLTASVWESQRLDMN